MANPTAETIIGLARDLLRSESGSDVPVIQDAFMLKALSDANLEWLRSFKRGSGTRPTVFLRETGFDLVADTTLSADQATTDVTASLTSAADFDSSGAYCVWDSNMPDVQFNTGKSTNTLTGVTNIGFAHESGDPVQKLYKLPSDFKAFRAAENYGDGVRVNGYPYGFMDGPPDDGYFSSYDDGTNKYLWLPRGLSGSASVLYEKTSTSISTLDDTVDVPEDYQFFLVWRLVQFALFGRGDDDATFQRAKAEATKVLREALAERNIGRAFRPATFGLPTSRRYLDATLYRQDA